MADSTRRYGLTVLNSPTDQLNIANYKFSEGDRLSLDRLLRFAVENHVHTGQVVTVTRPAPPTLSTVSRDGAIPGNTAVHYRYSIVDDRGQEALASQVATVQTPSQASAPAYAPRLSRQAGTLDGGEYLYAVSAATNDSTQETLVGPMGAGTLAGFGGWYVDLPPMPSGGQYFNVYRKGPLDTELVYLFSTGPEDRWFIDDGDRKSDRFRTSPTANTTYMTNQINVDLPQPWPTGSWTWKLYRTYDGTQWDYSLLDWIGPNGRYTDDGRGTRPGYPPETNGAVGGAPKIRLGRDTAGAPPTSAGSGVTRTINFNSSFLQIGPGGWEWVNEYQHAEWLSMRATVNRAIPPTVSDCIIGIDRYYNGTWSPVNQVLNPSAPIVATIPKGQNISDPQSMSGAGAPLPLWLQRGERLRLNVYQNGYQANETDHDLTFAVTLRVHDGLSSHSYVWETS